jgi:hypothetical protein
MEASRNGRPILRPLCPVCGYELEEEAWINGSPSDDICLSCGIQFGYHDAAGGDERGRQRIYARWRQRWIDDGMPWGGSGRTDALDRAYGAPPSGWDPVEQLRRIGVDGAHLQRDGD